MRKIKLGKDNIYTYSPDIGKTIELRNGTIIKMTLDDVHRFLNSSTLIENKFFWHFYNVEFELADRNILMFNVKVIKKGEQKWTRK